MFQALETISVEEIQEKVKEELDVEDEVILELFSKQVDKMQSKLAVDDIIAEWEAYAMKNGSDLDKDCIGQFFEDLQIRTKNKSKRKSFMPQINNPEEQLQKSVKRMSLPPTLIPEVS